MKNSKSLLKNGAIVFILTTMGSFLNYLCQLLMGRLFSVENYGIINSIFSLILIVSVVGNTAFMLMSKKLSEKNTLSIYKSIVKMVNKLSLILLIILIILLPITRKVISPNYFILTLTYIALITSIYPLVYQGVFGGLGNFISLGLYTLIIPFIKTSFLLIVWFSNFSNNLEIILAIISLIIGNLISIFVGYIFAKVKINKNEKDKQPIMSDEYKPVIIVNILMMFLMNVDILYLSYYFDSKTLGLYSSVLIFGKMIYYVVTALVTVMLPIVSKNSNDSKYTQKILNQTIFYTLILTIVFMIPLNIFTKQILTIAFGNRYIDAIEYVKYASFISITYSLNVILLNYLVGLNKTDKLKKSLIAGCIIVILNLIFLHNYKFICLIIVGIVNLCVFIYNLIYIKCLKKDLGGKNNMKYLYFFIGTEAELMKMYKVIDEAEKRKYIVKIISTGQNIIFNSPFLKLINKKIDIDLTKFVPEKKNIKNYLKWFIKTKKYGIKVMKAELKDKNIDNCLMLVHGDTLSTLMGSLISRRIKLKYVHVESGFRSHNWLSPFPEEIDRYFSSKKSIVNFCQNEEAQKSAMKYFKGKAVNTIYDTGIETLDYALTECKVQKLKRPMKNGYFVFALHRQENLLNNEFILKVSENILKISKKVNCIFIYHEQTKDAMERCGVWEKFNKSKNIKIIPRQDYINFINIVNNSLFVIGDGCGNQQEFYYLGKPYLILRTKVENKSEGIGWNALPFNSDFSLIANFYERYKEYEKEPIKMKKRPSVIIMDEIDKIFVEYNK